MTHPADPALAATLRKARAHAWDQARDMRTHYPGPNALRQLTSSRSFTAGRTSKRDQAAYPENSVSNWYQ